MRNVCVISGWNVCVSVHGDKVAQSNFRLSGVGVENMPQPEKLAADRAGL